MKQSFVPSHSVVAATTGPQRIELDCEQDFNQKLSAMYCIRSVNHVG